ncbi:hypothetical protein ACFWBB_32030 [Streptomyces sp. NPDC060000]|uniref:hypothetical protein n=1 Tax=Streptomyces sp. NPDC060000 TaxID=3347031 RepID=UPI003684C4C8
MRTSARLADSGAGRHPASDAGRGRRRTLPPPHRPPPPQYAQRLFDPRDAGAGDAQLRGIVAEGLQEISCKDGGRRADHLEVELNDIDYIDVSF